MKKLATWIMLFFTVLFGSCSTAAAGNWRQANATIEHSGFDDVIHAGFGLGISYLVHEYSGLTGWQADVAAVAAAIAIGTAKEMTDKHFDAGDVTGYALGAGIGCVLTWEF
jgi:hypothetical protein